MSRSDRCVARIAADSWTAGLGDQPQERLRREWLAQEPPPSPRELALEGLGEAGRGPDPMAGALEQADHQAGELLVVVDDEDGSLRAHAGPLPRLAWAACHSDRGTDPGYETSRPANPLESLAGREWCRSKVD